MEEKQLIELGFVKKQWTDEGIRFTEYLFGKGNIRIEILGTTLVEL